MAVRTCKKCGEDNKENAQNCIVCGSSLKDTTLVGVKDSEKEKINLCSEDMTICRLCSSDSIEMGYSVNLCSDCRKKLINRKIPIVIKVAACLVVLIMLFSFTKLPASINSGRIYYKAIEEYKSKDYKNAISDFIRIREQYPSSNEITGWIALTYFVDGKYEKSAEEFKKLPEKDKGLSSELNIEMNKAYQNLKRGG